MQLAALTEASMFAGHYFRDMVHNDAYVQLRGAELAAYYTRLVTGPPAAMCHSATSELLGFDGPDIAEALAAAAAIDGISSSSSSSSSSSTTTGTGTGTGTGTATATATANSISETEGAAAAASATLAGEDATSETAPERTLAPHDGVERVETLEQDLDQVPAEDAKALAQEQTAAAAAASGTVPDGVGLASETELEQPGRGAINRPTGWPIGWQERTAELERALAAAEDRAAEAEQAAVAERRMRELLQRRRDPQPPGGKGKGKGKGGGAALDSPWPLDARKLQAAERRAETAEAQLVGARAEAAGSEARVAAVKEQARERHQQLVNLLMEKKNTRSVGGGGGGGGLLHRVYSPVTLGLAGLAVAIGLLLLRLF